MAFHGVANATNFKIAAKDVNAYVRSFVSADDIDNGNVFYETAKSTTSGQDQVFTAVKPATSHLSNLWMAVEPEVVKTAGKYRNIDPDIRNFYNVAGDVFAAFSPKIGDIITLSAEALGGTKSTNTFVVATNADYKLNWAASAVSGLSLSYLGDTYVSLPTGTTIGDTQRVTLYQFEVTAVS